MEYSIYIIVRQTIIWIMTFFWLLFLVSVSSFQEFMMSQESKDLQKLIWFNMTLSEKKISPFVFFQGGYANYFQSKSNVVSDQNSFKKIYFNLFSSSSQFTTVAIFMCHENSGIAFCQNIQKNYVYSNKAITKENSTGQLLLVNDEKTKVIYLNKHGYLMFEQRKYWKDILEFIVACVVVVGIIVSLFSLSMLKFLDQLSFIQLTVSITISIYQSCEYIKQAIENWNSKNIQFWLFVPLIFVAYRILQQIIQKVINGKISIKIIMLSVIANGFVIYWGSNTMLFSVMNVLFVFCFKIERQTYQTELSKFDKKDVRLGEERIVSFFFFVSFSLLFKKKWIYMIHINPQFFIIGCLLLATIYFTNIYRKVLHAKMEDKLANKFKIKVLQSKMDLKQELSSASLSEIIQHQCPICYQKIESNWAKTPCDHIFHDHCLYQWLERNQTCPIDRKKVLSDKSSNSGVDGSQVMEV